MSLFSRLFGKKVTLEEAAARRLAAWQALPNDCAHAMLGATRFVVADVETTGLILDKDRLIAIGAVAVTNGKIDLDDSFEIILQQQRASGKDNILIHGISGTAQREGVPPVEAMLAFLEFLGKAPIVAYHVTFDQTMIVRALREYLGLEFKHTWLDLAYAVPALYPAKAKSYRALDDWIGYFGIQNFARHSALADSLATAQLFQVASAKLRGQGIHDFKGMLELEKAQRWVNWAN
ncbi:MAG: 3'-5' exonuclease [Sulfuricella sp.]|nr:3'-5' exonuclease [Sulfuricella sp.]